MKDQNLFHRVDTIGNIFTSGAATSKVLPMVFTRWKKFQSFTEKKKPNILFISWFNHFWEKPYQNPVHFFSVIARGVPLPNSNILQYYVKHKKFKVNNVLFPSGCEARPINLGNKNMKIGIFTGATSARWKNIFTDISRYLTRKHEVNTYIPIILLHWDKEVSILKVRKILIYTVNNNLDLNIRNMDEKFFKKFI